MLLFAGAVGGCWCCRVLFVVVGGSGVGVLVFVLVV